VDEVIVQKTALEDRLLPHVRNVLKVRDITFGDEKAPFAIRFRGELILESAEAFDWLEPIFAEEGMTLLFRTEGEDHVIMATRGVIQPKPSNPMVNLVLFILTLLSVLMAGVLYSPEGVASIEAHGLMAGLLRALPVGVPFAASLMSILVAHEFGHYLAARYHKNPVTLPYFFPFPGSYFGTMGAFIRLKAPPKNRRVLLDIGLAGPLAGLAVAIPVLLYGLSVSEISPLPGSRLGFSNIVLEGNSILYLASKYLITGEWLPAPASYGGLSPWLYWLRYFFLGLPAPIGGRDVMLDPIAWAGWAGLLVTALNLIPAGQLDGGHVIYVLLGRNAKRLLPVIILALVGLGLVWQGWFIWAALIFFLGRRHAQPLDEITPLGDRRRWLAILGLVVFVLVFIPVPLRGFLG
jgi:membrane-associated protease RseP (regulator of RpoE activity)